ncbi:hypothetical protein L3Q82_003375 [Scortum barcoo]|uniref:Uncharacterized protein n=1 Tax=Scortum barcoo TaxID=214431 RepID=A0ACB8VME2_9TELE|nr:hypothetical protein L3Q82_003375 [Scortum barcoo]
MSFLRRVAGRSLRDRVRSSVTWEELRVEPLLLPHIERSQLSLFRMPPGRLPREVFQACPTGRRPRGRPRTRWRDYVSRLAWERLGVPPGRAGGSVWDIGVISVQTVLYGRHDTATCSEGQPPEQISDTECSLANAADVLKRTCNGRTVCELSASVFAGSDPCSGTFKYLETKYDCLPSNVGQFISIFSANYGRHDKTTCSYKRPDSQIENIDCSHPTSKVSDTLGSIVFSHDSRCDGKSVCEFNTNVVRISDPCPGIYKYLETNYTCFPAIQVVACENSLANLYCDEGQVIFVYGADYGRRDRTTCSYQRPASQIENVYCSLPTSKVADSCNGKNSCTIRAGNSVFGDPCGGTYKYLEVAYICEYPGVITP